MDPFESIKATFFQECDELLTDMESGLLAMEAGDDDSETINAVFRAVHSVKGGAGEQGVAIHLQDGRGDHQAQAVFKSPIQALDPPGQRVSPGLLRVEEDLRVANLHAVAVHVVGPGVQGGTAGDVEAGMVPVAVQ